MTVSRRWALPSRKPSATAAAAAAAAAVAMAAVAVAAACGGAPSRSDVLAAVGLDAASAYEAFVVSARDLDAAFAKLCADPASVSESAAAEAATALAAARASWAYTAPVWTGPVMAHRSWAVVDWPPRPDEIADLLTDEAKELSTERIGNRVGADQRGLGAAEILLDWHSRAGGVGTNGTGAGSSSTAGGAGGADDADDADDTAVPVGEPGRRCDYLRSVSAVVLDEAELVLHNWVTSFDDGPAYLDTFSAEAEMGIDDLVNDSIFLLEAVTDLELGKALGETSAEADLGAIVEGPLGLGAADVAAHLRGIRAVMVGTRSSVAVFASGHIGLSATLKYDLGKRLLAQLDSADAAVAAIEGPLHDAVVNDPATVSAARAALKALQVTISTEVVSQLGVTIGFSDADGDSSA